jgi:TrmH family RNA methyltransferase
MAYAQPPIESRNNPLIKRIRSLQRASVRRAERAFVVEGVRAVSDAIATGALPEAVLISAAVDPDHLPGALRQIPVRFVGDELFAEISDVATPQGIMAIFPIPAPPPGPAAPELRLVLDDIRDPGNLGTLLRSGAGAGVTGVHLLGGCADAYNPKVVRSAMGAHFRVPIDRRAVIEPDSIPSGARVIATDGSSATAYDAVDMTAPLWIIVGSEATGLSESARQLATDVVSIPLVNQTESLNASVAGSIVMFEALRQRRVASSSQPRSED